MARASYAHQLSLNSLLFPGLLFCSVWATAVAGFSGSSWSLDTIFSNIFDIFAEKCPIIYSTKIPSDVLEHCHGGTGDMVTQHLGGDHKGAQPAQPCVGMGSSLGGSSQTTMEPPRQMWAFTTTAAPQQLQRWVQAPGTAGPSTGHISWIWQSYGDLV